MDWSTYYNMMSMGNYGYPMMDYSMMGYQNPYQNWNMPVWNYQNPYYYGGYNVNFKGNEDKTQTAAAQTGQTSAQTEQLKAKTETAKAEPKEYVSILKDGTLSEAKVYEGSPKKIADYRKEYKRKENNREIAEWATVLGGIALGLVAGPKAAKALRSKPGTLGDFAALIDDASKAERYFTSGTLGFTLGAVGALGIELSDGWKKDLKEKYDLKQLDAVA